MEITIFLSRLERFSAAAYSLPKPVVCRLWVLMSSLCLPSSQRSFIVSRGFDCSRPKVPAVGVTDTRPASWLINGDCSASWRPFFTSLAVADGERTTILTYLRVGARRQLAGHAVFWITASLFCCCSTSVDAVTGTTAGNHTATVAFSYCLVLVILVSSVTQRHCLRFTYTMSILQTLVNRMCRMWKC